MPISSDRGSVNVAPIASIADGNLVSPVTDFVGAFRNGFITVDDIIRRGASLPVEVATQQQNLQDQMQIRPLTRDAAAQQISADLQLQPRRAQLQSQQIDADLALQPRAAELREGQVDVAISALPTASEQAASDAKRERDAQLANSLNSAVPGVRENAIAQLSSQQVVDAWTTAHGQPPPDTLQTPGGGVIPKPIDEWVLETFGPNSLATNAQAVLTRPDVQQGYAAYAQEAQNRPLTFFKGDPEYLQALRADLERADLKKVAREIQAKAAPGILEAQAKSQADAPARAAKAGSDLRVEIHENEVLKGYRARAQAVQQIRDLTSKPNPSNQDDLGLIYATVRALDPISAVREGEVSLLQKGIGLPQNLVIQFNRLRGASNAVLTPEIRQGFAGLAETQAKSATTSVLPELRKYAALAQKSGVPVEDIFTVDEVGILNTGSPTGAAPATAGTSSVKPGDVVTLKDGRRIRVKSVTATGIVPDPDFQ